MNEILEKEKYFVVRNAISEELLKIAKNYYNIKFFIQKDYEVKTCSVLEDHNDIVAPFSVLSYAYTYVYTDMSAHVDTYVNARVHTQVYEYTYVHVRTHM